MRGTGERPHEERPEHRKDRVDAERIRELLAEGRQLRRVVSKTLDPLLRIEERDVKVRLR
ncbi:MAG: hypothetical protein ACT4PE_17065 [Candidatus Eiseniibacteriota bacterium]